MKTAFFALLTIFSFSVSAQTLTMSDETSDVHFETRHLLGKLSGTVKGVKGTAVFDSVNLTNSKLRFSVASTTFIHDDNYVGPDFTKTTCFDVKKFQTIELVSSSITKLKAPGKYLFNGSLTVKGITKPLSFPMTITPNEGGYDYQFTFPLIEKNYKLDCAFRKKLTMKVKAYGKRNIPEAGDK